MNCVWNGKSGGEVLSKILIHFVMRDSNRYYKKTFRYMCAKGWCVGVPGISSSTLFGVHSSIEEELTWATHPLTRIPNSSVTFFRHKKAGSRSWVIEFLIVRFAQTRSWGMSWLHWCMGHTAWAPEGREGRYQAGPKGPKPARRAAA